MRSATCPSDPVIRSDALAEDLARAGVPVRRDSGFAFALDDPTAEQRAGVERAVASFKRGAPAVFVTGMAMSDPSADQTIAEYRRTRH